MAASPFSYSGPSSGSIANPVASNCVRAAANNVAPRSGDRQTRLTPLADLLGITPPEGEAGHPGVRPHDQSDIVAFLRDHQAFLERTPRSIRIQLPKREDARSVQGAGPGDGPRLRARRGEGFRQPVASFVRVAPLLLEKPEVRGELERLGSLPMFQEPGKRGPHAVMIPFQSVHPRRVVRSDQMRLRFRSEREQSLGAVSPPCFLGHLGPLLRTDASYLPRSWHLTRPTRGFPDLRIRETPALPSMKR